jgi:site-specific DNA-adenine methylase
VENGCSFFKQDSVEYTCLDFRNILSDANSDAFYYCDPPYAGTTATYNENRDGRKGWSIEDELDLYDLLDAMSAKGIRWALSSVLNNKGKYNDTLAKWISNNSYHVNWFTNHTYSACGKGNSHAEEILVANYTPEYILSKPKKVNTLF